MRLYLAGADSNKDYLATMGIKDEAYLASYWYIATGPGQVLVDYAHANKIPLMLDSGAFSAWSIGAQIDLDQYLDYIAEHGHKFDKIIALDVIGDWRAGDRNLQKMMRAGCTHVPVPVFHTNEPFDYLRELATGFDSISVSASCSKLRQRQIIAWLIKVFKTIKNVRPDGIKVHGLALTSWRILSFFPWDSCDSTSWKSAGRFSNILVRRSGMIKSLSRDEWHLLRPSDGLPADALFPKRGKTDRYYLATRHNAEVMLSYVADLNRRSVRRSIMKD